MKLLWIDLNSSYAHASLALPALHAQMQNEESIEWSVISATINENIGMVVKNAAKYKPDVIAATAWLFNREFLLHVISRLKAIYPETIVILGGPEFLGDNYDFLSTHAYINCVFRGEGEEYFPKWIDIWNKQAQWSTITGLCYFDNSQKYHDNGTARVLQFDKLKYPESSRFFNWEKPFVQLETTRGCFNTCAFCVSGGEKPVRALPVDTIRTRLQNIKSHGIQNVRILDRTFNYNTARAKELLALFSEFEDSIRFHLEIHPGLLNAETKNTLKSMPKGILHLEAGIQSLHEEVLDCCRRKGNLKNSLDGLQFLCNLPNMETHADLIAGLPLYHFEQVISDIYTLAQFGAGEIQLESLKLLPGTEMRRRAEELNIHYSPLPPYEVLETASMSIEELQQARLISRLLDGYYNTHVWKDITRKLIISEKNFILHFLKYLIKSDVIDKPLSIEKRGLLLYNFCKKEYPSYIFDVALAWIKAGMSLKKEPAENIKTKGQTPPNNWKIIQGKYHKNMKLYMLPTPQNKYWFGYDPLKKQFIPDMIAISN